MVYILLCWNKYCIFEWWVDFLEKPLKLGLVQSVLKVSDFKIVSKCFENGWLVL